MPDGSTQVGWKFWVGMTMSMIIAMTASYALVSTMSRGAPPKRSGPHVIKADMAAVAESLAGSRSAVIARKDCPICAAAKKWARQNHLDLHFVEVSESSEARDVMQKMGFRGVPVLISERGAVEGFDPEAWKRFLQ